MPRVRLSLFAVACALAAAACHSQPATPSPTPSPAPAAAPAPGAVAARPAPGAPGAPRRPRLTPQQQDSLRRTVIAEIRQRVAGHETERAGTYFRNVQVLKDLTVDEFLRTMDEQYGRGLSWGCGNCHNMQDLSDDARKNKKIARQMQRMQDDINTRQMASIKELDENFRKVSCVTCHRGSNEPPNRMDVPAAAAAPAVAH